MSLLNSHLEQITLSSNAIADLPLVLVISLNDHVAFTDASVQVSSPRIFTTALLGSHDITALIRDTEAHERALFQVDPSTKAHGSQRRATRRGTMFPAETERESMASRIYSARDNRNQSAVARVLGHDMMEEIKRSAGTSTRGPRGEVNIEVLLRGAEILCNVYPVAGAQEKITNLRYRHEMISESIAQLEVAQPEIPEVTDEDIERELAEIRVLEQRKRRLEERVTGMDRDLGGLIG
ncbi:DASH complex subunit Spc34 [Penicillium expansum]|nr:DASH complex subunit Spc34 [Penicillium expansum]